MWGDEGAYGVWAAYLDRWKQDLAPQEQSLPPLRPEDFTVDTWTRLINRVFDALGERLQRWSDGLSTAMSRADGEFAVGRALGQARTGLTTVLALADNPALPEDQRSRLREAVERQVRSAQAQLEQELDRAAATGAPRAVIEGRRRTIRENPLTAVLTAPGGVDAAVDPWGFDPARRPRRTLAVD